MGGKRRRPLWLTAIIIFVVGYLCVAALMFGCQRSFMYFPDPYLPPPGAAGLAQAEEVALHTEDGLELAAWFVPCKGAQYTAAVFHGNAGSIVHRGALAEVLVEAGCSVLLVEYRGYAGNSGFPHEAGLYKDARAAARFLESREDVDGTRVIYFGKSLGTGPATQLAVERPPAALVLDSPFTSMADVAAHHYWYLPARWLVRDRYDNLARIGKVKCPVLVIHGDRDRIVPIDQGRNLFDAAPEPKDLYVRRGADHNTPIEQDRKEYVAAVRRAIEMAEQARKAQ